MADSMQLHREYCDAILQEVERAAAAGRIFPSNKDLAPKVNLPANSICKIIQQMTRRGELEITKRGNFRVARIAGSPLWTRNLLDDLRNIVVDAADIWGVRTADIYGPSREARFVQPRFAVYAVACDLGLSYPVIGEELARDHSSVSHGAGAVSRLCSLDPEYAVKFYELRDLYLPVRELAA